MGKSSANKNRLTTNPDLTTEYINYLPSEINSIEVIETNEKEITSLINNLKPNSAAE